MIEVFGISVKGEDHVKNEDAFLIDKNKNLFAVADGVSIPQNGGASAKLAVDLLKTRFKGDLKRSIEDVNKEIYKLRIRGKCGYTTLTCLHLSGDKFVVCNIGDSPCYLFRDNELFLLTELDKINFSLAQAIGDWKIYVRMKKGEIRPGDVFLFLTDGISDYVFENELIEIISKKTSAEQICKEILNLSFGKIQPYNDDKTCVCIIIK